MFVIGTHLEMPMAVEYRKNKSRPRLSIQILEIEVGCYHGYAKLTPKSVNDRMYTHGKQVLFIPEC